MVWLGGLHGTGLKWPSCNPAPCEPPSCTLVIAGMAQVPPPMAGGMPDWHVLHHGPTTPPEWLLHNAQPEAAMWWFGLLAILRPLLERVSLLPRDELDNYRNGTHMEAHPSHPEWWTKCLIPRDFRGVLQGSSVLRFKPISTKGLKGGKWGYFMLKEGGCSLGHQHMPSQEIHLHRLLCFMYRGPPPPGQNIEACHMCENRMCLAPWHLVWAPHGANIKGGMVHKRNRHKYHPYEAAE